MTILQCELVDAMLHIHADVLNSRLYAWRCREVTRVAAMLLSDITPLPPWVCKEFGLPAEARYGELAAAGLQRYA